MSQPSIEGMTGIYLGDCLDLMSNIPDGSVDMVLTDLPYGVDGLQVGQVYPGL